MSLKISVILPVYNGEAFLAECVRSILNQSYQNIELIIVNDGSTDSSPDIMEYFVQRDERVKVFHCKNQGVSRARNYGLKKSTGDFIGFIDADDLAFRGMYESLLDKITYYNADIAHCSLTKCFKTFENQQFDSEENIFLNNKSESIIGLLNGKEFEPGVWNKLYRREIILGLWFNENFKINEDLLFNYLAFLKASVSVYINAPYYFYRSNPSSVTHNKEFHESSQDVLNIARLIIDNPCLEVEHITYKKFYVRKCINIVKNALLNNPKSVELYSDVLKDLRNEQSYKLGLRLYLLIVLIKYPSLLLLISRIRNEL